jgi:hypothetical protein
MIFSVCYYKQTDKIPFNTNKILNKNFLACRALSSPSIVGQHLFHRSEAELGAAPVPALGVVPDTQNQKKKNK